MAGSWMLAGRLASSMGRHGGGRKDGISDARAGGLIQGPIHVDYNTSSSLLKNKEKRQRKMKINRGRSRLLKPAYHTPTHPPTDALIPLSPFETVTFQIHVGILYAYRPPNPSNEVIEQGLR
ncbi:hypothetical protein EJ110_NYTH55045 [Nymphaea thermarum]|nr:hypothetical protein EJ110_NYTH55045 [Nymphaea thermarum]